MKITVSNDDGTQSASFTIQFKGTAAEVAESFALCCGEGYGRQLVNSITVTDSTAVPAGDGFKFKVGQRVRLVWQRGGSSFPGENPDNSYFITNVDKDERGRTFYQIRWHNSQVAGTVHFQEQELEPAEQP